MEFDHINIFSHLLWLVPVMVVLVYLGNRRRDKILNLLVGQKLRGELTSSLNKSARVRRLFYFVTAIAFAVIAAAEPWWGVKLTEVDQSSRDVLICLDSSRSMLAKDISPSRLKHAKWWIKQLVKEFPSDRFGLINFSGEAIIECPLTISQSSFINYLENVDTNSIPLGGTNIGAALTTAYQAFEGAESSNRAVILLSDGDELSGDSTELLADFKSKKIPVFTVGIGDPTQPGIIQLESGKILYDENNNPVESKLNEKGLARISRETGATYVRTTVVSPMIDPIIQEIENIDQLKSKGKSQQQHVKRFQIPLFISVLFIFAMFFVKERKKMVVLLMISLSLVTQAQTMQGPLRTQQAPQPNQAPEKPPIDPKVQAEISKFEERIELEKQKEVPSLAELDRLYFNLATTQQHAKLYDDALVSFQSISMTCDKEVKRKKMNNMAAMNIDQAKGMIEKGETDKALEVLDSAKNYIKEALANSEQDPVSIKISKNNIQEFKKCKQIAKYVEYLKKLKKEAIEKLTEAKELQKKSPVELKKISSNLKDAQAKVTELKERTNPPESKTDKPDQKEQQAQQQQKLLEGALDDIDKALDAAQKQQMPFGKSEQVKNEKATEQHIDDALAKLNPPNENQDQQQQDQEGEGEENKDQKEQDQEGKEQEQKDQKKGDKQEKLDPKDAKEGEKKKSENGKPQQARKIEEKQAEAILRQISKSEKDFKEELKKVRREQNRQSQPDKNW